MVLPCQLVPRLAAAVQVGSSDGCAVNGMVRSFQPIHLIASDNRVAGEVKVLRVMDCA